MSLVSATDLCVCGHTYEQHETRNGHCPLLLNEKFRPAPSVESAAESMALALERMLAPRVYPNAPTPEDIERDTTEALQQARSALDGYRQAITADLKRKHWL